MFLCITNANKFISFVDSYLNPITKHDKMSDQGNDWKTLSVPDGKGGFMTFSQCFQNKMKNNGGTEMTFKERIYL